MIGELIAVLFLARDIAHREHLRVTGPGSFARHSALGDFYGEVIDLADSLAEAYMGRNDVFDIPLLDNPFPAEILASMQAQLKWIEDNRYKAVPKDDTALQNIIDEVVTLYLSTIYKLKRLK